MNRVGRIVDIATIVCSVSLFGCGGMEDLAAHVSAIGAPITAANGGVIVPLAQRTALELTVVRLPGCTGTLVRPNWVLTARHCVQNAVTGVFNAGVTVTHDRNPNTSVSVSQFFAHPDIYLDAALLKLSSAINVGQQASVSLFAGGDADIVGQTIQVYGYGGVPDLSRASMTVTGVDRQATNSNHVPMQSNPVFDGKYLQIGPTDLGDSGGPSFFNGALVGITGGTPWKAYAKLFRNWANGILSPATNNRIASTAPTQWGTNIGPALAYVRTGDVNHDSLTDIVQFNQNSGPRGAVFVALGQTTGGFGALTRWHTSFSVDSQIPFVGDVDGDGNDDIVTFDQSTGAAFVAISNGANAFGNQQKWDSGISFAGENPALGDVNGDGRADAVSFQHGAAGGPVLVALSCGAAPAFFPAGCNTTNSFGTSLVWHSAFSYVGEVPMLGDLDGDGRADLISLSADASSSAFVSLSRPPSCTVDADCVTGACETNVGFCLGSQATRAVGNDFWGSGIPNRTGQVAFVADMNGDGYGDLVNLESGGGTRDGFIGVALSRIPAGSTSFDTYTTWQTAPFCRLGDRCLVADKNRDGRSDVFRLILGGSDTYALSLP